MKLILLGCYLKVYKKKMEGDSLITTRCEGSFKDIDIDEIFRMFTDVSIIEKTEPKPKQIKIVEQISKNCDITYVEAKLPFPLSNRDFVSKRLYLCNKDDAELVKKLGLFEKKNKYYVVFQQSVERPEYPVRSSPVRGEIKMSYWIMEEDPVDKTILKFKAITCQDIGGNMPVSLLNKLGPKATNQFFGQFLDNYHKIFGKTSK